MQQFPIVPRKSPPAPCRPGSRRFCRLKDQGPLKHGPSLQGRRRDQQFSLPFRPSPWPNPAVSGAERALLAPPPLHALWPGLSALMGLKRVGHAAPLRSGRPPGCYRSPWGPQPRLLPPAGASPIAVTQSRNRPAHAASDGHSLVRLLGAQPPVPDLAQLLDVCLEASAAPSCSGLRRCRPFMWDGERA